jgi:hypothetical protein
MCKIHSIRTFLLTAILLAIPAASFAQLSVGIAVNVAPPEIPVYEQPLCPGEGYIWTPGYWAYGDDDYYWVPGTWVLAPRVGVLWTPGYWGWGGGGYYWHAGYWGPHVGFYGGINYGFGYVGEGYYGGRWDRGHFAYNRAVNNVNVTVIHNTYNTRITNNYRNNSRVSYNGGTGGIRARETARDRQVAREQHIQMASVQAQHEQAARSDRSQFAKVNNGRPNVAATPRPGAFNDRAVVHAREGTAPNTRGNGRSANAVNANNNRGNPTRADRPNNASQPNVARGNASNRPNAVQPNDAPRANSDRPANAHTVTPRNTQPDRSATARPNNNRANTNDRPATHTNAPRNAQQERPTQQQHSNATRPAQPAPRPAPQASHAPAQQQHSAPRNENKPQPHERDPHGKP